MARQQKQKMKPNDHKPRYARAEEEINARKVKLVPLNEKQELYISAIRNYTQIVSTGYAGTAKTYIPAVIAANNFLEASAKGLDYHIIITRPIVSVGADLGYFKGSKDEKYAEWAEPVMDIIRGILGDAKFDIAVKRRLIQGRPLSTMRGASFDNAFIILDEAQNLTTHELKMFLTRQGKNCKVIVNGDVKQTDLRKGSGLATIIDMINKYDMNIPVIEFGVDDIVRSQECKDWIIAFDKEGI